MKILQVTYVRGVAGSEKFLLNAIPGLKQRGHEVDCLVLYAVESETLVFQQLLAEQGINCYLFPISGLKLLTSLRGIGKLMRTYDVVNSHLLHADLTMSLAKRFFARKTFLLSGKHGYEEWYNNQFGFDPKHKVKNKYWRVARFAESRINASFAISKGLQHLYTGLGICPAETTQLIYYGFRFEPVSFEEQYRFGNPQLCIVGRLTAFKGHRFALSALELLKEQFPEMKLVIVGWGELEEELRESVTQKGLTGQVIFTGFQPNPRSYMTASDVVLIPSVSEGFGIVIAEAMSVRKPIVAFNVPSPSELLVHEKSGLLAEPFDIEQYAGMIADLLTNKEKAAAIAEEACHVVTTAYALENMIDGLELFYQRYSKNTSK
ncbi:MAG TPA: glycosyltransferase [Fluviicola sp.]|nr:glycosyltransferase [Fluviicola sp.]